MEYNLMVIVDGKKLYYNLTEGQLYDLIKHELNYHDPVEVSE